jgi:hypothetical protein
MALLNPPDGVMVKLKVTDRPAVTVCDAVESENEKSGVPVEPVPVRLTTCGLPEALSVTLTVPVRVPAAVGVNFTLMLQFPPAASELPQLLV